jgi:hypothetical protein
MRNMLLVLLLSGCATEEQISYMAEPCVVQGDAYMPGLFKPISGDAYLPGALAGRAICGD